MAKRMKQCVEINGEKHWITGRTYGELLDRYLELCLEKGVVAPAIAKPVSRQVPLFGPYLEDFCRIFKSNQESLTVVNRNRIIQNHILPKYGNTPIDQITTASLQLWYNELGERYSRQTVLKIRNTMSPALDAAVQDGYISRNPMRSRRLEITGAQTVHHKAIPKEKMADIWNNIYRVDRRQRCMVALLATTGMRFEQVLGLRWQDIDLENRKIHICRAVVHPTRNQPQVKTTKTQSSTRTIPLSERLLQVLQPVKNRGYILESDSQPLSYTEARRSFDKIRKAFGLQEYSAHDFRDTCATEWRQKNIPADIVAKLLGHSKSDITEKRYIKYRDQIFEGVRDIMNET